MSRPIPFNTPVVIHDGQGHYRGGLVFASRQDQGEADDYAPVTVVTLSPKFEPAGAARGNVTDAVEVLHDVPYVEEAGKFGYSNGIFDGEEPLTIKPKPVVLAVPVPVVTPEPVTDSTGELTPEGQAEPARLAIVGGVPVTVREIQPGIETPHGEPEPVAPAATPAPTPEEMSAAIERIKDLEAKLAVAKGEGLPSAADLDAVSAETAVKMAPNQAEVVTIPVPSCMQNLLDPAEIEKRVEHGEAEEKAAEETTEQNPVANTQESVETPIEPQVPPEPAVGEEGHPV